jgi:hypothetical protein
MADFQSTAQSREVAARNSKQLQAILQMLETASRLCSARQDEIRPLINALNLSPATTEEP